MSNQKIEIKKFDYEWYSENVDEYRKDYTKHLEIRNKFLLVAIGGGIITLINLLDKLKEVLWMEAFIWSEIFLMLSLGVFVLLGMIKEVEICEEYISIYGEIYREYANQERTIENVKKAQTKLDSVKKYNEYLKNERKLKIFLFAIFIYTIIGSGIICIVKFDQAYKQYNNIAMKEIKMEKKENGLKAKPVEIPDENKEKK